MMSNNLPVTGNSPVGWVELHQLNRGPTFWGMTCDLIVEFLGVSGFVCYKYRVSSDPRITSFVNIRFTVGGFFPSWRGAARGAKCHDLQRPGFSMMIFDQINRISIQGKL